MGKFKEFVTDLENDPTFDADFIPVIDESINSPNRTKEVQELLIKMLLLSRKRGRPSTKEEDIEDAA